MDLKLRPGPYDTVTDTLAPSEAWRRSPLDDPPLRFARQPFYAETLAVLESVRDHDLERLTALCDVDFGIVDVDLAGRTRPVRTRVEWERFFYERFATLTTLGAATDFEVLSYQAHQQGTLGFSVLEYRQSLTVDDQTAWFDGIATIVWKRTPSGWRQARWHGSVVTAVVPEPLRRLTNGAN
jgi:SnoaL-like domain